jgi:hypothetical protein
MWIKMFSTIMFPVRGTGEKMGLTDLSIAGKKITEVASVQMLI